MIIKYKQPQDYNQQFILKLIFLFLFSFNFLVIYGYSKSESVSKITKKAKKGDREYQLKLGMLFLEGTKVVKKDEKKAFHWISQSAAQDFPLAQLYLAQCYLEGIGVDVDPKKSLSFLIKSADQEVEAAQFKAAMEFMRNEKFELAAKYFYRSSDNGNLESSRILGQMFLQGKGVIYDVSQATKYFGRAAEHGDLQAKLMLAKLYSGENGHMKPNHAKMVQFLWDAASENIPEAQAKLGECFEDGFGLTKDTQMAVKWYKKAADQNYVKAMINLGNCYALGKGQPMDQKQAFYWYDKAAKLNDPIANYHLAMCYVDGFGIVKDEEKAFTRFLNAARAGIADAQYRVGNSYERGIGTSSDLVKAKEWYNKAVIQNHVLAKKKYNMLMFNSYNPMDQNKLNIFSNSSIDDKPN